MSMAKMIGITNQRDAQATIKENCAKVFQKAHMRKTFKGVAEVIAISSSSEESGEEEEKMQIN